MPALLGRSDAGQAYMIEEAGRSLALRKGPWKYIQGKATRSGKEEQPGELYNLDTDVGEQNNVAEEEPTRVREMQALLQSLIAAKNGVRGDEDR